MYFTVEFALLTLSILFFLSILAGKAGSRFGVPALLLFLTVGMLFGSDGLGIPFDNIPLAQAIGTIALCIILFSGGMDTNIEDVRPVLVQGVVLATVGVLLTAVLTALGIWFILGQTANVAGIGFVTALLLASTMSSTDSASVFSILRSKGLHLKYKLRPLLEMESGSNDPMAYILTITLIGILKLGGEPDYPQALIDLFLQLVVGGISGFALGKLAVLAINRLEIDNRSLYPILVFTFCLFIFSATYFLHGNGFLGVYVAGLVIGNSKLIHKRSSLQFFDGIAWISQLLLFLTLGLLVNPRELVAVFIPGVIISAIMIFLSRPITVFLCLLPFRNLPQRAKIFVSWVGLRGAVPIVFAIIVLAEGVPHSKLIFNIVFVCTLISLVVQGTSLSWVARKLGLIDHRKRILESRHFDIQFAEEIGSITAEVSITHESLKKGNRLMDLQLSDKTLAVMIKRGPRYFVPKGRSVLEPGDKLLLISDDKEHLTRTITELSMTPASALE